MHAMRGHPKRRFCSIGPTGTGERRGARGLSLLILLAALSLFLAGAAMFLKDISCQIAVSDASDIVTVQTNNAIAALMADGGGSKNTLLMQLQADLANCALRCARFSELSALGAAWMAGLATGVYRSFDDIPARQGDENRCVPRMPAGERENLRAAWRRAIECARLR